MQHTMMMLLAALSIVFAALVLTPAVAQDYPSRPITLIVPYAPGGSASTAARSIADKMSETLGQQIIIDNRPGAGGAVATRAVARSEPDGYTVLIGTSATMGTAPSLIENLGYDPRSDFEPIGVIAATPNVIVVHPSFQARSLPELIARGKEGPILYGSPGTGTLGHLTVELLAHRTGMQVQHVPYKGAGPALTDLLGGHIRVLISAVPNVHAQIAAGAIDGLAVAAAKRSALLPSVPTFAETGLDGFDVPLRWGLVAAAGTRRSVIESLNRALNDALSSDEVRQRLALAGADPEPGTPRNYTVLIDHELTLWSDLVKAAGIRPE
jgi:tripartite-type tricarboxylate transporter receptor subunit TctC